MAGIMKGRREVTGFTFQRDCLDLALGKDGTDGRPYVRVLPRTGRKGCCRSFSVILLHNVATD